MERFLPVASILVFTLAVLTLPGCAKTTDGGSDGKTHFLACKTDSMCTSLGDGARCTDGYCEPAISAQDAGPGGSGKGGGGSGGGSADAGPAGSSCVRMDARSNGDDCVDIAGYGWNGAACGPIVCGCAGEDCDRMFASERECEDAYRQCAPVTMCTRPSECVLAGKVCCNCEFAPDELVAVSRSQQDEHLSRVCRAPGSCTVDCGQPDPFIHVSHRYVPACAPATRWEGGECLITDLARLPCTQAEGCRVRTRACCECNASTAIDALIAIPSSGGNVVFTALCTPGQSCPDCEALYPENVEARCGTSGFCELYQDGVLVPP